MAPRANAQRSTSRFLGTTTVAQLSLEEYARARQVTPALDNRADPLRPPPLMGRSVRWRAELTSS